MAAPAGGAVVAPPSLNATTRLVPRVSVEYEWRVEGLTKEFFTAAAVGHRVKSPPFSAHGSEWRLELYPNGERTEDKDNISLFLWLLTQNTTATPVITLRAGVEPAFSLDADAVFSTCEPKPEGSAENWGSGDYLSHTKLLKNFDAHVPNGMFTVAAVLQQPGVEACTNPIAVPAPSLSAGLSALLASGEHADVTLVCGDERIAAHSLLLRTRSPVFAA
jgi:speckle-type POZ protein